jgi:hypothetical protein
VNLGDHLKHLIWTSAHGGRHDEESEKPIINTNEVTQEIIDHPLIVPIITIRVEGTETYGTAWYLHRDRVIFAIALWHDGRWTALGRVSGLPSPTFFVAVPKILGESNVRFRCDDPLAERALRVD